MALQQATSYSTAVSSVFLMTASKRGREGCCAACVKRPLVQILMVVERIQMKTVKIEVGKGPT